MPLKELDCLQHCPFCIYGAGTVAISIYTAIKTLYHRTPLFFLVTDRESKGETLDVCPAQIDGIVIKSLSEWKEELVRFNFLRNEDIPYNYLVATPEIYHSDIMESLHTINYLDSPIEDSHIILVTNKLENEIMDTYYGRFSDCITVTELISEKLLSHNQTWKDKSNIQIFQAKSHMDKQLCAGQVKLPTYIYPIQVGAALTEQTLVDLKDNTGDNISQKNRNYCELTATYHAWKHCNAAYKGLCHYRRIFDISEKQMQALLETGQDWDVILPYPSVHYPDISAQHIRYVKETDWDMMLQALRETAPEYFEAYEQSIAGGNQFFNNFNMMIAKAEVFDEYCNFLFRVLERTEELTVPKGWERADRFAGYLGENLTTIFFSKNRNKFKVVYAGKIYLT